MERGDVERVEFLSHTLKSRWLNLGARRLAELCADLEERARDEAAAELAPGAAAITEEFGRVQAALARLREPGP